MRHTGRVLDANGLVVGCVRTASGAGLVGFRLYGQRSSSISFEDVAFVTDDEVRLRTTHRLVE